MEEKINTVLVSIIACDSLCTRNVLTHEYGLGARNDAFSSFSRPAKVEKPKVKILIV